MNKLWVATNKRLICIKINDDDKKFKIFKIEPQFGFSSLSQPPKTASTIRLSFDKMKILWYKCNYGMAIIDIKRQEVNKIIRGIIKMSKKKNKFFSKNFLADIEQFLKFQPNSGFTNTIFFTNKSMIGEILYSLDMESSKIKHHWQFYDPHRKKNS